MPPSNLDHNKFICHRQKRLYLPLRNTFFMFYFFTVILRRRVDDEHRDGETHVSRAAASQLLNPLQQRQSALGDVYDELTCDKLEIRHEQFMFHPRQTAFSLWAWRLDKILTDVLVFTFLSVFFFLRTAHIKISRFKCYLIFFLSRIFSLLFWTCTQHLRLGGERARLRLNVITLNSSPKWCRQRSVSSFRVTSTRSSLSE